MLSKDYELFIWSCFPRDFHSAREGLLHDSLLRLGVCEKQRGIDLLLTKLKGFAEGEKIEDRVIEAVGWLKLTEAIEILQRILADNKKNFILQAQIGLALHRITGYPQGVNLATMALDKLPLCNQFSRLQSAEYLMVYAWEYKSAVRRLLHAADDCDDFVAYHSISLLIFIFDGKSQITDLLETVLSTLVRDKKKVAHRNFDSKDRP